MASNIIMWMSENLMNRRLWEKVRLMNWFAGAILQREERSSVYFKYQKQYSNSRELCVLSTTASSSPGSVDTGTGCAVRVQ